MIPSTASKRHMPVIKKAKGKYAWDIDGNKYLDFSGSNLTVILGHRKFGFPNSPNFPGVSYLEKEVSDLLSTYTGTKHWRLFKNGTDAVSCAIRLARHILSDPFAKVTYYGYAGSHNEYVYTFNDNGIPPQESEQIHYDNKNRYTDILVYEYRYEQEARNINAKIYIRDTLKDGIRALFDERFIINDNSLFRVRSELLCDTWIYEGSPDFVLYGKSIGNGYPISCMTGKDELMERIDEIYYSTTFGGENTGLYAIKKTIEQFEQNKDKYYDLYNYAKEVLPAWTSFNKEQIDYFLSKGVINNGYWQIMLCHNKSDIDRLAKLWEDMPTGGS